MFQRRGIKEYTDILDLQKNLGLDIDQVKAKLLSEEGILRLKAPEHQNHGEKPSTPNHHKPVHLKSVKTNFNDQRGPT
jgi:hypothetical protein